MHKNLFISFLVLLYCHTFSDTNINLQTNYSSLFFEDVISANYSRTIWKDRIFVASTFNYNQAFNIYAISSIAFHYRKILLGLSFTDAYTRFDKATPEFSHDASNIILNFKWNPYNNIAIRFPLLLRSFLPGTRNRFQHSCNQVNIGIKPIGIVGEVTIIDARTMLYDYNFESSEIKQIKTDEKSYSSMEFAKLLCGVRTSLKKFDIVLLAGQSYWDIDREIGYPNSFDNIDLSTYELRTTYHINDKFSINTIFEFLQISSIHPYSGMQISDKEDITYGRILDENYIKHKYSPDEKYFRIGIGVSCSLK